MKQQLGLIRLLTINGIQFKCHYINERMLITIIKLFEYNVVIYNDGRIEIDGVLEEYDFRDVYLSCVGEPKIM